MGEKYVKGDDGSYLEPDQNETELRKPAPSIWFAGLLFVAFLGLGIYFWYQAETQTERQPMVVGYEGPKIIADSKHEGRYILVREGDTSKVVGGSAVMVQREDENSRAERITPTRTSDLERFQQASSDDAGDFVTVYDVWVTEVTSDESFVIQDEKENKVLVRFPEADEKSGEYAIRVVSGDRLTVTGEVKQVPEKTQVRKEFGLSDSEVASLPPNELFIDAYRLVIH